MATREFNRSRMYKEDEDRLAAVIMGSYCKEVDAPRYRFGQLPPQFLSSLFGGLNGTHFWNHHLFQFVDLNDVKVHHA